MDAMASPPGESTVLRLRDTNPEFVAAAKALFGYPFDDFKPEHAKWLTTRKSRGSRRRHGVLEQHPRQNEHRNVPCESSGFSSVPGPETISLVLFVDSFLFPSIITNRPQEMATWACISAAGKVLQRYMRQESVNGLPADLAGYEAFVRRTLAENQKRAAWP